MSVHTHKMAAGLQKLHMMLAFRDNASSQLIGCGVELDIPFTQAVAMALTSLGGAHAPVAKAFKLWSLEPTEFEMQLERYLDAGEKVPGFGSSFVKGEFDSVLEDFGHEYLGAAYYEHIHDYTTRGQILMGKDLYPNAAAYTAVAAHAVGQNATWAEQQLLLGRLPVWAHIYDNQGGQP